MPEALTSLKNFHILEEDVKMKNLAFLCLNPLNFISIFEVYGEAPFNEYLGLQEFDEEDLSESQGILPAKGS